MLRDFFKLSLFFVLGIFIIIMLGITMYKNIDAGIIESNSILN